MVKNCVKVDNIFCYFMLIIGVLGYIFKMFYISVGMAIFIGSAPLIFYHRQLFILLHVFSYSSCKSIYFNINIFFSSLLNFLDIKQIFIFSGLYLHFLLNNVNGFRSSKKRVKMFDYFKGQIVNNGIIFLQETHSSEDTYY